MKLDAVIAVRGGPDAKSRLADRLNAEQRAALVDAMLADMLATLVLCPSIARVHVTTPTPSVAHLAACRGASVIQDSGADELNGAFARARLRIAAETPGAVALLLPGDLPRLQPADIEACAAAAGPGRLVLAPADADGGTSALAAPAEIALPLAFGPGSFGKHLAGARSAGLKAQVIRAEGLAFDIDRPADLDAFLAMGGGGRTGDLLQGWRTAA
jgi:2-phospho-L-lactate guanylyltransferase